MRLLKIKDIGKIVSGSTPDTNVSEFWNGNIPWVTPREINKLDTPYLNDTERKITEAGLKACSTTILPKGSILFTSRAPIGLVAIANIDVATNQGFKSLQLFEGYYPLYIYYTLKYFSKRIDYLGTGTTFKELSKNVFEKFEIPVPESIEDQIRISTALSKIEMLILQRKESISLLNDFIKNTFLYFFGQLDGEKVPLSQVCEVNPKKSEISYIDKSTQVSFVSMASVSDSGDIDTLVSKKLSEVWNGFTYFRNEDVVFAKITPSMENGKGAIAKKLINNIGFGTTEFHVLRPIPGISTAEWLYYLTMQNSFRKIAEKNMVGSAGQKRVPTNFFSQYKIIRPSISDQGKFAEIVEKTEQLRAEFKKSLLELENMFASLCQLAFKGILDISRIPIDKNDLLAFLEKNVSTAEVPQVGLPLDDSAPKENKKTYKQATEQHAKRALSWDDVAAETKANWIKAKYIGYHFNNEMLHRFLLKEHFNKLDYYSSEEIKRNPPLTSKEDLKKFLYNALNGEMPFLKIQQHFYNANSQDFKITLTNEDAQLIKDFSKDEISGIYFSIETT